VFKLGARGWSLGPLKCSPLALFRRHANEKKFKLVDGSSSASQLRMHSGGWIFWFWGSLPSFSLAHLSLHTATIFNITWGRSSAVGNLLPTHMRIFGMLFSSLVQGASF